MKTNRNGLLFRIIMPVFIVILVVVAVLTIVLTGTIREAITKQRQRDLQEVAEALMNEFEVTKSDMINILAIVLEDLSVRGTNWTSIEEIQQWLKQTTENNNLINIVVVREDGSPWVAHQKTNLSRDSERLAIQAARNSQPSVYTTASLITPISCLYLELIR